ncbi:MAG: cell wall metabolism sensor histidine kinase WalK [Clostridia bacterium]|nr:cell wall metabolism sensor histidine kinase WalK [Clostridia bacterium]
MRYSIRTKLFAALGSLILLFVVISLLLNNLLMEKYYLYNKENTLLESYKTINKLYNSDDDVLFLEMEKLENSKGVYIIILDKNFNTLFNTRQKGMNFKSVVPRRNMDNQRMIESLLREKDLLMNKNGPIVVKRWDSRLNANFINLFAVLNREDFIILSTPVAAIQESVQIANQFFLLTGLLTILIGGLLIFFITTRFTKPILLLNDIAKRMATLDFSQRYPVKTRDEIGHLGESINSLSEQLQKSIAELKEANEKLMEDIEKERKIDEMRKEFITNVSHELKTPIALIQGYAEGLMINVNDDEENKNYYCNVIMDEAYKMNRLVRQLLELSQMEAGHVHLEKSEFDIFELMEQVIKKNMLILKEKDIRIHIEKEKDSILVNADYDKIEQVLMNYLNNAVNHADQERQIRVGVKCFGCKVRISVYNSGQHIPKESLEKVWTSFYKVDKARTRMYGGTGLGLSIVRAIQESHRNKYGVNNVEGGVEFWFDLDLAE